MNVKFKNFLKNAALVIGTFVFCFVALEVVLRIAGYGRVEVYQPDPMLYWKNLPNQDSFTTVNRKRFVTNSKGTRGEEFSEEKPPNTIRIMTLGDSRTFGWGLGEDETWSAVLEKLLQERVEPPTQVEVINAGVNSYSFAQMNVYFREIGVKYDPDFVVLGDANLWTQFSENNSPEFVKTFMRSVRLKNLLRRSAIYHYFLEIKMRDSYTKLRARFIPVDPKNDQLFKEQQAEDPAAFFRASVEGICQTALTNGVKPILLFLPVLPELTSLEGSWGWQAKTNVAEKLDIPLIDMRPELAPKGESAYLPADPSHFTPEANVIIAKKVADVISERLK